MRWLHPDKRQGSPRWKSLSAAGSHCGPVGHLQEGFGIATGISRLVGGQQVFAVGGEVDGTNACAIEDIAQSVTLLWIGCRRDNAITIS